MYTVIWIASFGKCLIYKFDDVKTGWHLTMVSHHSRNGTNLNNKMIASLDWVTIVSWIILSTVI